MLQKNSLSVVDDVGKLYVGDHNVYRAIDDDYIEHVQSIINCGLINELIKLRMFPETKVSKKSITGYKLVLEHKKIRYVTYPYEWSPKMLRGAAFTVLKVNLIANKYGYELKDAHPFNILYDNCTPVFVDFGSFQKKCTNESTTWVALEEFVRSYYYPLYLFSKDAAFFARSAYLKSGELIPHVDFYRFKYCFLRVMSSGIIKRIGEFYYKYKRIYSISDEKIIAKFPKGLLKIFLYLKKKRAFPFAKVNFQALEKPLKKLTFSSMTQWGNYHIDAGFYGAKGEIELTPRMRKVLDFIERYKPKTILELAGNQGILSRCMEKMDGVESVICSDYDDQAIDQLYTHLINKKTKVMPLVLDFMLPYSNGNLTPPYQRINSELVVALAITHHLLLTQKFDVEFIIDTISKYTTKYLIIEFMPLGLFDGVSAPPIPEWYHCDWFIKALENKFKILEEIEIESNRTMLFAEKKITNGS